MRDWWFVLAAVIVFVSPLAVADQRDPRLDRLFVILTKTQDAEQAAQMQEEISRIWLDSSSEQVNALMARGLTAVVQGQAPLALAAFDGAIELAPDYAEAWYQRASLRFAIGQFLPAIGDAEQALALEPRHYQALAGLGEIYLLIGDADGALNVFEQALAINPHQPTVRAAADDLRLQT